MLIPRLLTAELSDALAHSPAVALLGPRQVGKTTLATEVGKPLGAIYLDLESELDRAKLASPELYLSAHTDKLVIIDEVHRAPGLFPVLRGLIDRSRREGRQSGQYLLLGSASLDLLHQAGETLAGRIAYMELAPLQVLELADKTKYADDMLWVRGGLPDSLLAASDARSLKWRADFIRSYLERDIPQFGRRIAAETLRRFWTMLAHHQGGLLNLAQFARNLDVESKTAAAYLDLLVDLLLVRRLQPWLANVGKRLVRAPRVYIRDSGLVHALLNIADKETLLAHPVIGQSWEGFVIENALINAPTGSATGFYRSSNGAEIDLLIAPPGGELWAIEIKRTWSPKLTRGFHEACRDLQPARKFVVYPGDEAYRMADDIEVLPLAVLAARLRGLGNSGVAAQ